MKPLANVNKDDQHLISVLKDRRHDGNEVRVRGEVRYVQQPLQLLQGDGNSRTRHETHNRRMREELNDET